MQGYCIVHGAPRDRQTTELALYTLFAFVTLSACESEVISAQPLRISLANRAVEMLASKAPRSATCSARSAYTRPVSVSQPRNRILARAATAEGAEPATSEGGSKVSCLAQPSRYAILRHRSNTRYMFYRNHFAVSCLLGSASRAFRDPAILHAEAS